MGQNLVRHSHYFFELKLWEEKTDDFIENRNKTKGIDKVAKKGNNPTKTKKRKRNITEEKYQISFNTELLKIVYTKLCIFSLFYF